jgi:hypothetical protein
MNPKITVATIANDIVSCFTSGSVFEMDEEQYRCFGLDSGIAVSYENSEKYVKALQQLFELDKNIHATYTYDTFERRVADLAYPHVVEKTAPGQAEVMAFFKELASAPIDTQNVFRPILGIKLPHSKAPFVLGPYTLFDTYFHREQLMLGLSKKQQGLLEDDTPPFLIQVTVQARESTKALEIADAMFERFERVIRFMMGQRISKFEVGILNYQGMVRRRAIVLGKDFGSSGRDKVGPTQPLSLDDPYFADPERGFDKIWENFEKPSTTLAQRLLLAVEWVGQSYGERVPSIAFIKAAISLELLFTPTEGGFVTPSIISQLSESVALVVGKDVESRHRIEADVKRLYKIRSAIAHAGMTEVKMVDLTLIQQLARGIVMKMFVAPSLNSLSSVDEMFAHFKSMKYSCAAT